MIIGIDYDGTITADPEMWYALIATAKKRGHTVIVVTGREDRPPVPEGIEVIHARGVFKRTAARRAGYRVDVWIDDEPGLIEPQRLLMWED